MKTCRDRPTGSRNRSSRSGWMLRRCTLHWPPLCRQQLPAECRRHKPMRKLWKCSPDAGEQAPSALRAESRLGRFGGNAAHHDLQIAMLEPSFQENNGQQISTERLNGFFQELQRQQSQHPVHTLSDARTAVWTAGQIAQMQLQVRPSATDVGIHRGHAGWIGRIQRLPDERSVERFVFANRRQLCRAGRRVEGSRRILLIVNVIHNSPGRTGGH